MPEAKCSKCGADYHGWALLNPRHQTCSRCGTRLKIRVGERTVEGYSPFDAEKLIINLPPDAVSSPDKEKGKEQERQPPR